jgi:hypothetical protein
MKTGLSAEYILRKSLCREPHYASGEDWKQRAEGEIDNLSYAHAYAEPGYTQPEREILFANWNYFPCRVTDILKRAGYGIEWSDEWTMCDDCGKALRTSPDSYSWQPSHVYFGGDVCLECLKGDAGDYLETLEDNPRTALNTDIDPAEYGYIRLQDKFENGFHQGQTDDPKKIYASLKDKYSRILFKIDEVSQFYTVFSVWHHPE